MKILSENVSPTAIGLPLFLIRRSRILPLLPLGDYMVKDCENKLNLPEPLVQKILYGKSIIVKERFSYERALLVDSYGDFLAFVFLRGEPHGTKIIPELDIGWYLREGG